LRPSGPNGTLSDEREKRAVWDESRFFEIFRELGRSHPM
jgi:hypothetical protein